MPPEPSRSPVPSDLPDLSGPADLETRLAEAAARARATRAIGGTLSPRAARDLRARLRSATSAASATSADAEAAAGDVAATPASDARRSTIRVERRRWAREDQGAGEANLAVTPAVTAPVTAVPAVWRTGRARRWTLLLRLAALLVVAAVAVSGATYAATNLAAPGPLSASVIEATGATATRLGAAIQLAAGTALQVGDTVTVGAQGTAVLALGDSRVRLADGSSLHLDRVDARGVTVAELGGRAYYRVISATGAPLRVVTGPVTWTATGTAFEADREPVTSGQGSGQERVTLLALQDPVTAMGPGFETTVWQGDRAVVYIGSASPTAAPAIDGIPWAAMLDPWIQANGALDAASGWPLGALADHLQAAVASPGPTASPSAFVTPSVAPTDTPFPTTLQTPSPSPTHGPTPAPTPRVTPAPTPSPTPGILPLSLSATSCPGGVVLDWSTYGGKNFYRYVTLRSPGMDPAPPAAYPPTAGYIAQVAGTTGKGLTSAVDPQGGSSAYLYRTVALSSKGALLAASSALAAGRPDPVQSMGLTITPNGTVATDTDFSWTPFAQGACFTQYEVRYASTSAGAATGTIAATASWLGASGVDQIAVPAGPHYFVLIVRKSTALGSLVVAESSPFFYLVP